MIDVETEHLLTLRQACREPAFRNPTSGNPAHVSTLHRHAMHGARALDGTRVRLETVKTPSGLRTSREAVARFIRRLSGVTRVTASGAGRRGESMPTRSSTGPASRASTTTKEREDRRRAMEGPVAVRKHA